LIFSCPSISNKIIKIDYASNIKVYYGDEWLSTTNITNQVQFVNGMGSAIEMHLICGDDFILLTTLITGHTSICLVGKLTNGNYIAIGLIAASGTSYNSTCIGKNTTNGVNIYPISFSEGFVSKSGKLYKQPLIFGGTNGTEENTDGSLATIQ